MRANVALAALILTACGDFAGTGTDVGTVALTCDQAVAAAESHAPCTSSCLLGDVNCALPTGGCRACLPGAGEAIISCDTHLVVTLVASHVDAGFCHPDGSVDAGNDATTHDGAI